MKVLQRSSPGLGAGGGHHRLVLHCSTGACAGEDRPAHGEMEEMTREGGEIAGKEGGREEGT